jgi:hypothetical protein
MQPFAELGALIEHRWRDRNYNESLFPQLAAEALCEAKLSERIDPWEIVRWVHSTSSLPEQMDLDARFGDPPITLFVGNRFYIDAYYWLDGTTSIHQHSFAGAFQVLLGGSVHSRYNFEAEQEISQHFLIGKVNLAEVTLLKQGDIREIIPGREFIHSLFHLDRPSVTITIRTHKVPAAGAQYSYFKPSIAIDPFFENPSLIRQTQTVALLLGMKHPQVDTFIADLIDSADFHTAYCVLKKVFDVLCHRELEELFGVSRSFERFQALLACARRKHGPIADHLLPVFEEEWRQNEIARRRAEIKPEHHRFFLALLMNVPDRAAILKLVQQKFPDQDAVELILQWLRELATTKVFGSKEPNILGFPQFGESHLLVLRELLRGRTKDEIKRKGATALPAAVTQYQTIAQSLDQIECQGLLKPILA